MSKKPTHTVYQVTKTGEDSFWNRIGAAWEHGDGEGFNIKLNALPLEGEIVMRVAKEKREDNQS
ncbi:MAG: hypothetical protein RJS97_05070 [Parvibaculaceae bacterium]|jgi:hypothetical protein|tara:strand:+ start:67 stop:258 length:192 start_codon:yes stop_codon:yes gene_type:complete